MAYNRSLPTYSTDNQATELELHCCHEHNIHVLILLRIVPLVFLLLSDYQDASYTDDTVCSSPATLQGFSCLLEFRHLRTMFL